jgi:hypothetical protein
VSHKSAQLLKKIKYEFEFIWFCNAIQFCGPIEDQCNLNVLFLFFAILEQ